MPIDPVTTVLAGLEVRLRGSRRLRRDLIDEARDGLADAERRYRSSGMDRAEARAAAAAEFGDPASLAAVYQAELVAAQARWNACVMLLGLPVAALLWTLLWMVTPRRTAPDAQRVAWIYDLFEFSALISAVSALCGLALLVGDARWHHDRPRVIALAVAAASVLTIALNLCASIAAAILVRSPLEVIQNSPLAIPVYLVTAGGVVLGLQAAWRSIRT